MNESQIWAVLIATTKDDGEAVFGKGPWSTYMNRNRFISIFINRSFNESCWQTWYVEKTWQPMQSHCKATAFLRGEDRKKILYFRNFYYSNASRVYSQIDHL